uniref:Uncharacterized protein n=1 Tax=Saimiri boliviensis boliviensis TaxID=39432 RepID=A0A2K6TEE1_SAIBB
MTSLQKRTLSEKMPAKLPSRKKVNFLDMSLDDIVICKKFKKTNAEIEKSERQIHSKKDSPSRQQSNDHGHRHQKGEVR